MTTPRLSPYDQHWADLAVRMGRAKPAAGRILTALEPEWRFDAALDRWIKIEKQKAI